MSNFNEIITPNKDQIVLTVILVLFATSISMIIFQSQDGLFSEVIEKISLLEKNLANTMHASGTSNTEIDPAERNEQSKIIFWILYIFVIEVPLIYILSGTIIYLKKEKINNI